jgi:hypothetical protein
MTLGEAYPLEIERVTELLADYVVLGPTGAFGAIMIKDVLKRATHALAAQDLAAMVVMFQELKGCQ